jgi:hypothetical protein
MAMYICLLDAANFALPLLARLVNWQIILDQILLSILDFFIHFLFMNRTAKPNLTRSKLRVPLSVRKHHIILTSCNCLHHGGSSSVSLKLLFPTSLLLYPKRLGMRTWGWKTSCFEKYWCLCLDHSNGCCVHSYQSKPSSCRSRHRCSLVLNHLFFRGSGNSGLHLLCTRYLG